MALGPRFLKAASESHVGGASPRRLLRPLAAPASFTFVFLSSLQAVETNLASKDSHWVFVNEVRAQDAEGRSLPRTPCPWGVPRGTP